MDVEVKWTEYARERDIFERGFCAGREAAAARMEEMFEQSDIYIAREIRAIQAPRDPNLLRTDYAVGR